MSLKHWLTGFAIALCAAGALAAAEDEPEEMEPTSDRAPTVLYGEPVDKVYAPNIDSWAAVDNQRLILWVTAFKPYLITLNRRVNAINWEYKIGINNRSSFIDARFDRIYVDGFPYSIQRMEKLTRETARALLRRDRDEPKDKNDDEADTTDQTDETEQEATESSG